MSETYSMNSKSLDDMLNNVTVVTINKNDTPISNKITSMAYPSVTTTTPYNVYHSGGSIQGISSSGAFEAAIANLAISDVITDDCCKTVKDDTLTTLDDNFTLRYYKDGRQIKGAKSLPKVTDVQTYGNKVVKVTFSDGSFTKAVKDDEDDFLTAGIAICYLKKMLAADAKYSTNAFNKVISKIIKIMDKNRKAAEKKKKDEAEAKAKRLAKEAKKNKKKIKRDKRK